MIMNLISIHGTLKRDLQSRFSTKGEEYYFTFLAIPEQEKDLAIFLWRPQEATKLQAQQELTENTEVILFGKYNKEQTCFNLQEWQLISN